MARSMTKRRQEAERQRNQAYETTLRRVFSAPRAAPDFDRAIQDAMEGFVGQSIRPSAAWRPKLKTRDPGRLRLAAARYLFARYPVPAHLEAVWLDASGLDTAETLLRKRWYVTAAGGGSLYGAGAADWLSRKEVHAFLNAPAGLDFEQAFWFGIALGSAADVRAALTVGRSRIARSERAAIAYWRQAVSIFVANPMTGDEIDDIADFLAAARMRDGGFSLKGRTLGSLRRLSAQWHHDVAAVTRIEAMQRRFSDHPAMREASWAGSSLADWSWQPPGKEAQARRESFAVVQLTTAEALVSESRAMQHCVWTYAGKCIQGHASIWSLRRIEGRDAKRLLTVELDRAGCAVQVRGFANRRAEADEAKVLERWARARGVTL